MANFGTYDPVNNDKIQICCITLNLGGLLRLLACPPDVIPLIRTSIEEIWGKIKEERTYHGSHEFKMKGNPWQGEGDNAVASRRLLVGILTVMAKQGWNLIQSADVSKNALDKDSLFFERCAPDPDASLFCVSFNMGDKIRVIDAPEMMHCVKEAVVAFWPRGIQKEREYKGSLELKLVGHPWYPVAEHAVHSKLVLCQVLANFRALGYKLYGSIDISYAIDGHDLESWVFRKVGAGWQ